MSHVHAKHGVGMAHGTMQSNHIDRTSRLCWMSPSHSHTRMYIHTCT